MRKKSSKQKKRREVRRSWLAGIGTFLLGLAAVSEVIFNRADISISARLKITILFNRCQI